MRTNFLYIFIDGLGLGTNNEANPLMYASMPTLKRLIGGELIQSNTRYAEVLFKGIDATMGVEGIPQSATGQTALFTGKNAAQILGYHLPAFPNKPLVDIIKNYSVLKQMKDKGLSACFANAYRKEYFQESESNLSVTTHCVLAAGLPFLLIEDLLEQRAVNWDITNQHLHDHFSTHIPVISAYEAGKNLAGISQHHHLTIFESFETDLIGHRRDMEKAIMSLQKLDEFISGVIDHIAPETNIIITSDHGNIEEINHGLHSLNPVPLIVKGKCCNAFEKVESIMGIVPVINSIMREVKV